MAETLISSVLSGKVVYSDSTGHTALFALHFLGSKEPWGIENGEFNAVDPAIAGRLILSSINWMSRWFDPTKEKTSEEVVEQYANIILHGIEKR
jgi:hypothetical protein